jgi:hypothetical protein
VYHEGCVEKFNELFIDLNTNIVDIKQEFRIRSFDINTINYINSTISKNDNVLIKVCFCHQFIDTNPYLLDNFVPPSLHWIDDKMNECLNIACHIRRGDVSLTENTDRYIDVNVYIDTINQLTNILSGYIFEYNIYCDSITSDEVNKINIECPTSKITFHINTDINDTFKAFVNSDILIAGKSSFSYAASFLRKKGIILYIPIAHAYSKQHVKLESKDSIFINKEKIYNCLKY